MVDRKLTLRLLNDTLAPGAKLEYPAVEQGRIFYLVEGSASLSIGNNTVDLQANEARLAPGPLSVDAGPHGAKLLRWELTTPSDGAHAEQHGSDVSTLVQLEAPIALPAGDVLMRCDRVDFPPGGVAYTHVHQGPGIRCLLHGEITVTVEGESKTIGRLGSWFEAGPNPVFAAASKTEPTAFVRVMVLPAELQGKSSITYVSEEDRAKPKPQSYTIFVDEPLPPRLESSKTSAATLSK